MKVSKQSEQPIQMLSMTTQVKRPSKLLNFCKMLADDTLKVEQKLQVLQQI